MARRYRTTVPQFTDPVLVDSKIPAAIREAIHNSLGAGAHQASFFEFTSGSTAYLVFGHDGMPFDDMNHLTACMLHNSSEGESGALGNGMKAAAFITNNDPKTLPELHVLTRSSNGEWIGAGGVYKNHIEYDVRPLNDAHVKILLRHIEGCHEKPIVEWANVFYIHTVTGFEQNDKGLIINNRIVRAVSEMSDQIDEYSDGLHVIRGLSTRRSVLSDKTMQEHFSKESVTVSTRVEFEPAEAELAKHAGTFDVDITLRHFPKFSSPAEAGRPYRLDNREHSMNSNMAAVANTFRVYCDLGDIDSDDAVRRLQRVTREPVYVSNKRPGIWELVPSLAKLGRVVGKDLEHAWVSITGEDISTMPDRVKYLEGIVTMDVHIRYVTPAPFIVLGDTNALFLTSKPSVLRDVAKAAAKALAVEPPEELRQFVEAVTAHYPKRDNRLLDLETEVRSSDHKLPVIAVRSIDLQDGAIGGEWPRNKKFPVDDEVTVLLELPDGSPLTGPVEVIGRHVQITPEAMKGVYTVKTSGLHMKTDSEVKPWATATPEEYSDPTNVVSPQATLKVVVNGRRHRLSNYINVPSRRKATQVTSTTPKVVGTKTTTKRVRGWFVGDPELVGEYRPHEDALLLNEDNLVARKVFENTFGKFDARQRAIYYELQEYMREEYYKIRGLLRFSNHDSVNTEVEPDAWILNRIMLSFLEAHKDAKFILSRLDADDVQDGDPADLVSVAS